MIPSLQAFYGGHPQAWFHIPGWSLNAYVEMLPELQAEQQLLAIQAASSPHMKDSDRADLIAALMRRLSRRTTKAKSFVEALFAAGIPIRRIPTKKKPKPRTRR